MILNSKKYLLYALGEIILIVAGVLIAVNINNYNDEAKQVEELNSVLNNISNDLKVDILNLDTIISGYEERDSIIKQILSDKYPQSYFDTINETNYLECIPCVGHHIGFPTFAIKLDGYNQLKDIHLGSNVLDEKLSQEILSFYKGKLEEIKLVEQILSNTIIKNLEALEEYDWYSDFIMRNYNPNSIKYFQNNLSYKNKLATFKLLAIENHLALLKTYKEQAAELVQKIEEKE